MIKTKVVSKRLIKPSTPTPQNLNNYKVSFIDEFSPRIAIGVLLFYHKSKRNRGGFEASLAKTLVQFYPLAGRYNRRYCYVHCNDQGAGFAEAEAVDVELNDVVAERNLEHLSGFFPSMNDNLIDESIDPVLSIQTTELKHGGLVVGISVSHRVFDVSSLATFIAAWSSNSRSDSSSIKPIFDFWKLFPPTNLINYNNANDIDGFEAIKPIAKMFSFNKDTIASLRSRSGISRVRAVSAVIVNAFIRIEQSKQDCESRPFLIIQAIDIRKRTIPPLPRHSCGNLAITTSKEFTTEIREMGINEVVGHLSDSLDKSIADCAGILSMDETRLYDIVAKPIAEAFPKMSSGQVNMLAVSDWSKFTFYEADFGCGKPIWTSIVAFPTRNIVVLMRNREGNGIEAWVHLNKNDMSLFEQDEEIRRLN